MEIVQPNLNMILTIFLFAFLLLTTSATTTDNPETEHESEFTYEEGSGKGPKGWGGIDEHWKLCSNGKLQSPIDLLDKRVQVLPNLGALRRVYRPAPALLKNRGHDIMVEWEGNAGELVINGTEYKLKQAHWHTPSEHTLNSTRYEQELHIVHKSADGGLAVIGILYKYGLPDPFLDEVLHHIKSINVGDVVELGSTSPRLLKFRSREYFRYIGSLTVPPCTEGVIWTILKKVRTVSREQIKALRDAVHDGFEANARPVQGLNGRPVFIYRPKA